MICLETPKERTVVDPTACCTYVGSMSAMPSFEDMPGKIEVGEFYEIDRSKLPSRSPSVLLLSVRVVMVTGKTALNVTVRYPSTKSLERFFGDGETKRAEVPEMDERFIMGPGLADEVLVRRIPAPEFRLNSDCKSFWLVQIIKDEDYSIPASVCNSTDDAISKKGACLIKLQSSGFLGWGTRRAVYYGDPQCSISSLSDYAAEGKKEEGNETNSTAARSKRRTRRLSSVSKTMKNSAQKLKLKSEQHQVDKGRWTVQRYKRATRELLEVLKIKNAFCGNPVSRCELRQEARKRIGDTGLLDHLLKHVAGEVAPDGIHRFRRRFDPEGFMEYWLEDAGLVDIRKQAGVVDPFWIPPPGWQPGDPICTHGSECTAEIKQLREEVAKMKREMQELESVTEEDLMALDGFPECLDSVEPLEMPLPDFKCLDADELKEKYEDMVKKKAEVEMQLCTISETLREMEVLMNQVQEV